MEVWVGSGKLHNAQISPGFFTPPLLSNATICFWFYEPFHSQDVIIYSPYCLPYHSYYVCSENMVMDQLIMPSSTFFFILITCLLDIVLIL